MISFFQLQEGGAKYVRVRIASARRLEIRSGASDAAAGIGIRETESEKREKSGRGKGGETSPKLILMLSSRRPKRA